jgi:hypothetical protein
LFTKNAIFKSINTLYICQGILKKNYRRKKMARVLISMPEKFLDEIDSVANNENRTRSELIREALRTYMYRNQVRNSSKSVSNAELLDALLG